MPKKSACAGAVDADAAAWSLKSNNDPPLPLAATGTEGGGGDPNRSSIEAAEPTEAMELLCEGGAFEG